MQEVADVAQNTQNDDHSEPKSKKQKRSIHVEPEVEDTIIQFMKDNPALYNVRMSDFRKKVLKEHTWRTFAESIGFTFEEITL